MAKQRLGKGLQALITDMAVRGPEEVQMIAVGLITPNPFQPRRSFHPEELNELADSIRQHGVIQPITVRVANGRYELVVGERRWRAAGLAGLSEIPCMVKDWSDSEVMEIALIENLQRENLNPMEEARALAQLQQHLGLTQEQLAGRVGKSRPYVANAMRLLTLSTEVAELVSRETLSAGHARAVLSAPEAARELLAREIVSRGLTVREAERRAMALQPNVSRETNMRRSSKKLPEVEIKALERQLRGLLQTRVEVKGNAARGAIIITYHNTEELERLLEWFTNTRG